MQPLGANGRPADPVIEAELDYLATAQIANLRIRYRELFRTEPPNAFGPDLLRRSIAYRIQEKAYGGLSRETQRLLEQLIKALGAKPNGRIELPRRIKPGSLLVRQWKGKSHRVMVLAEGFTYDGQNFTSLSEIASLITGTNWNGPRFFGLRLKGGDTSKLEDAGSNRKPGAKRRTKVTVQSRQRRRPVADVSGSGASASPHRRDGAHGD